MGNRIDVKKAGWRNVRTSKMPTDKKKFDEGWERIFGKKEKTDDSAMDRKDNQ